MNKESKRTLILTTIVCLIPIIVGLFLYNKMPDQIAIHWDFDGNPNGWANKAVAVFVLPGSLAVLNLIMPLLLKMDPKYGNISGKMKTLIQWIIPIVALFGSSITLAAAIDKPLPVQVYAPMFVGVIFIIIGNYLPKTSQSYTVGIKIPWTLADEENWNKTHRMAGVLWVIGGIMMIISAFTPFKDIILVGGMIVMVIVPMVYSYMLFRKKQKEL